MSFHVWLSLYTALFQACGRYIIHSLDLQLPTNLLAHTLGSRSKKNRFQDSLHVDRIKASKLTDMYGNSLVSGLSDENLPCTPLIGF